MSESQPAGIAEPRIVDGPAMLIAGLRESFEGEAEALMPGLWQRFMARFGRISGQQGKVAYGVSYNFRDRRFYDYIAGVEVADPSPIDDGLAQIRIPAQRYLVFNPTGFSSLRQASAVMYGKWLPASPYRLTAGPRLERFSEDFNPEKGLDGVELWIPIEQ